MSFEEQSTEIDQGLKIDSAVYCKREFYIDGLNWRFSEKNKTVLSFFNKHLTTDSFPFGRKIYSAELSYILHHYNFNQIKYFVHKIFHQPWTVFFFSYSQR